MTFCSDSSVIGHSFAQTGTTDALADKQRKPRGSAISAPVRTEAPSASSAISAPVRTEAPSASSAATRGLVTTDLVPEQEVLRPPPAAASTVSSCDELFGDSVNDDMFRDEFPSQLPPDRKVLRSPVLSSRAALLFFYIIINNGLYNHKQRLCLCRVVGCRYWDSYGRFLRWYIKMPKLVGSHTGAILSYFQFTKPDHLIIIWNDYS